MKLLGILIVVGFVVALVRAVFQFSQGLDHGLGNSEKSEVQTSFLKQNK